MFNKEELILMDKEAYGAEEYNEVKVKTRRQYPEWLGKLICFFRIKHNWVDSNYPKGSLDELMSSRIICHRCITCGRYKSRNVPNLDYPKAKRFWAKKGIDIGVGI